MGQDGKEGMEMAGAADGELVYSFEEGHDGSCTGVCCARLELLSEHKRTAFCGVCFLLVGLLFTVLTVFFLVTDGFTRALPFAVVAFLMGIPGAYSCGLIAHALLQTPGYSMEMLPSYDLT